MNFFSRKTTNKIFMYLLTLSFCKILKKCQSYEDVPFSGPKWPICPEQNFFGTNHHYYFHLPIGLLHCAKFKKILTADPELKYVPIFGPKWPICPKQNFFGKLLISFSSNYYQLSLYKIKKKSSGGSRVMRMCNV